MILTIFYNQRKDCNKNAGFTLPYWERLLHINIKREFDSNNRKKTAAVNFFCSPEPTWGSGKKLFEKILSSSEAEAFCLKKPIKWSMFPCHGVGLSEKINPADHFPLVGRQLCPDSQSNATSSLVRERIFLSNWSSGTNLYWTSREYFHVKCWSKTKKEQEFKYAQCL